jgi:hypothetical protein
MYDFPMPGCPQMTELPFELVAEFCKIASQMACIAGRTYSTDEGSSEEGNSSPSGRINDETPIPKSSFVRVDRTGMSITDSAPRKDNRKRAVMGRRTSSNREDEG